MSILAKKSLAGSVNAKNQLSGKLTIGKVVGDNTQTYILVDEDGNEIPAVLVDEETILTATVDDIRLGSVAITDEGVVTGEKYIPGYFTNSGKRLVTNGSKFVIPSPSYNYTQFQALICPLSKDVYTERVVIDDHVYDVLSSTAISDVLKDSENTGVDLGITNESGVIYLIRYFMYTEV